MVVGRLGRVTRWVQTTMAPDLPPATAERTLRMLRAELGPGPVDLRVELLGPGPHALRLTMAERPG